jgi:SAM-dependent methyltransferase
MKIIYDKKTKQLVYYGDAPSTVFWDGHWRDSDLESIYNSMSPHNLIVRKTAKYLKPADGEILEGGCGIGQFVHSLNKAGFCCTGVDTAEETIFRARKINPNLKIMDIRSLDYQDSAISGYWSLGVIEHFWSGYGDILDEMYRVLKPQGYAFIIVPSMSRLRRLKAAFGIYEKAPKKIKDIYQRNEFYQFILSPKKVVQDFSEKGFKLVEFRYSGGTKGIRDEIPLLRAFVSSLERLKNKNLTFRILNKGLDILLAPISGHTALYIFQKETCKNDE